MEVESNLGWCARNAEQNGGCFEPSQGLGRPIPSLGLIDGFLDKSETKNGGLDKVEMKLWKIGRVLVTLKKKHGH